LSKGLIPTKLHFLVMCYSFTIVIYISASGASLPSALWVLSQWWGTIVTIYAAVSTGVDVVLSCCLSQQRFAEQWMH